MGAYNAQLADEPVVKSLRLLFIVREPYPTFRSDVAALFGKYLPRMGIHSDFVSERDPSVVDLPPWGGGREVLCEGGQSPLRRQWQKLVHGVREMVRARRSLYDAVQVRDLAITSLIALVIGRIRGIPVFVWMSFPMCEAQIQRARQRTPWDGREFWFPLVQGSVGRFLLNSVVLKQVDHVFVQSDYMRDALVKSGMAVGRVSAVPMGVDLELLHRARRDGPRRTRSDDRRVIVHLGILEASRNSEVLVDVLSVVRNKYPQAELLCIGSCESVVYQALLEQRIAALDMQGAVRITGWVSQVEAWEWAGQADIGLCLIPANTLYMGASPTKLIECLALGLPMVVNEHPEQRHVIEESGAGYCVEWSVQEIAAAILGILADPDCESEMRLRGPEYVARHRSYDRIAATVADRYRELLGKNTASRD